MAGKKDYFEIFKDADKDSSGFLDHSELLTLLRVNGYKGSDEELKVQTFFLI